METPLWRKLSPNMKNCGKREMRGRETERGQGAERTRETNNRINSRRGRRNSLHNNVGIEDNLTQLTDDNKQRETTMVG